MKDIRDIKKDFFSRRNGITADVLRKAGMSYKIIYGLQIPQIAEIARETGYDNSLASLLWNDNEVRESRILAAYLFDPEKLSFEKALQISKEVKTREEAEIMAFRLFRRLDYANRLIDTIREDPDHPFPYCADALGRFQ